MQAWYLNENPYPFVPPPVLDAAGHHPHIEQPKAFVERIVSFLEEERPCRPGT